MRHYEIVFLVHPDLSDQTQSLLSKFSSIVSDLGGLIHRSENIGKRKLAYPIEDQFKASYALMNVECSQEAIAEIKSSFRFNDSIIRDLIVVSKKAYKEVSALSSQTKDEEEFLEPSLNTKKVGSRDKKGSVTRQVKKNKSENDGKTNDVEEEG